MNAFRFEALAIVGAAALLIGACSRKVSSPDPPPAPPGQSFGVHLQDGFRGDPVQVFVDGRLVFDGKPTTDERLGFAEAFSFTTIATSVVIRVTVPAKTMNEEVAIDLTKAGGIGISIRQGRVSILQTSGFGYD